MPSSTSRWHDADLYLAAALGGALGASARYAMELLIPTARDGWPTATFVVNLTGAFVLGIAIVLVGRFAPDPDSSLTARRARPFLVTGVLGGYTTFSTYMVEAHGLLDTGQPAMVALYIFGSLLLGVLLVGIGMAVGRKLVGASPEPTGASSAAQLAARVDTEDEG
ncbi:MAG: CrcB family protein [Actinobacteria bacterium]|nr:CrcB family protein [Actinomycetota bacterium]